MVIYHSNCSWIDMDSVDCRSSSRWAMSRFDQKLFSTLPDCHWSAEIIPHTTLDPVCEIKVSCNHSCNGNSKIAYSLTLIYREYIHKVV